MFNNEKTNRTSLRKAEVKWRFPRTTLTRLKNNNYDDFHVFGVSTALFRATEIVIVTTLQLLSDRGYGFTKLQVVTLFLIWLLS